MRNLYGLLALIMGLAGIFLMTTEYGAAGLISMCFMGGFLYRGQMPEEHKEIRTQLDISQLNDEMADTALSDWKKAQLDYSRVETARKKIQDSQLSRQLGLMQQEAARLMNYVEKHPERIAAAGRFIHYYQDRAASLSEQFLELEDTKLDTSQVRQVKERLRDTLVSFDEAYSAEFTKILNNQLLDMDAELTVMQQSLEAEGISNVRNTPAAEPAEIRPNNPLPATGIGRKKKPRVGAVTKAGETKAVPFKTHVFVPAHLRMDVLAYKVIMSALAICLGTIGAHKFYQGKNKWGFAYIFFCWTTIPTIVSVAEGIRYLFMPVNNFYEQYYR